MKKIIFVAAFLLLLLFVLLNVAPMLVEIDWRGIASDPSQGELTVSQFNKRYNVSLRPEPKLVKYNEKIGSGQARSSYYFFQFEKSLDDKDIKLFIQSLDPKRNLVYFQKKVELDNFPNGNGIPWWNFGDLEDGVYLFTEKEYSVPRLWIDKSRKVVLMYDGD